MIAIPEKISDPVVNMPYLRFLLFILILGSFSQPALGQELPGVKATTPPSSIIGPTLKTRRQRVTEPANEPSNVISLAFDKEVIYSSCAGKPAAECADVAAKIRVTTVAEDKENDILVYRYTVIAGRIIGQGPSVVWDLSGVSPGKYSIVVGSDDGCGVCGRTMTKEIEVKAAPDVEKITLSKNRINSWCPIGRESPESQCSKQQMVVDVTTIAKDAHDGLTYYYTVTGGKIVGDGPNVKWDLSDTEPGRYVITAGVGKDNVILGNVVTRSVTQDTCPACDPGCSCPVSFAITGPTDPVKPGDTIVVNSHIKGDDKNIQYKWSVTAGSILGDPARPSIMVKLPADAKEYILVTFELLDTDPGCYCQKIETLMVYIKKKPTKSPKQL
jgi:hypothetical protein